ncbi:gamma-glutamyltransferase family protein [Hydrogenophaga sp. Root209]|uniref:gamma-glutamyltransferase family protein n=1 Tax=Hydrogenophaga sp. Root209 TaxID=1736490 RepID=UPI0009E662F4|nr:gamma-glutamyltransferase family protein [Hydrogenophaga sp. Root209]
MTDRTHPLIRFVLPLWISATLAACAGPVGAIRLTGAAAPPAQSESASGFTAKPGWTFRRQAVAAANPLATEAGAQILRVGGSAVDAAIAVQMMLTLVEPQSSGIGGGAFLLHHDGRRLQAFDGRETAPAAVDEKLFLNAQGDPLNFATAVASGRSVGVPGAVMMLALAHRQHGKLPWARLFDPAIVLAEQGFPISPRLHTLLAADSALKTDPVAATYFYRADGQPHPVGHVLRNPELAQVLRNIATMGPIALHEGPVARAIVSKVHQHPTLPGTLSMDDLQRYQPREREALCHDHATALRALRICGFPPPSSGAIAVGQILGLLARTPQDSAPLINGLPSVDWLHSYNEASRLAFADRARYLADPDFVAPPAGRWTSLLDARYLDERAHLISAARMPTAAAGEPGGARSGWAPMPDQPEHGTSHVSIVDGFGNALAMTTTIESAFGARLMVTTDPTRPGGFLLNNELTDFSFTPRDAQGQAVANRVEPGKRPRSSMSPTLVFDKVSGELLMSTGSPGGAFIIHYTAKVLHGVLQWGLSPQAAVNLPNFGTLGGPLMLEQARFPLATVEALQQRGHTVQQGELTSGAQALVRSGRAWRGGADPRREGIVAGD